LPVLSQQPLGQLVASQTHLPPTQRWPAAQATQAPPPVPQNWLDVPAWQVLPLQQPLGQLVVLQTQAPPTHAWPAAQATQMAPLVPQLVAVCDARATQAPLLVQQPPGQVVALHLTHFPLLQNWPLEHLWPQPPQLLGSVWVLVQAPLQQVWPLGHTFPALQEPPHMHLLLQQSVPLGQPPAHPPAASVVCGRRLAAAAASSPIPPPRNRRRETSPARARVKSSNR
jgi:hypothetical protein